MMFKNKDLLPCADGGIYWSQVTQVCIILSQEAQYRAKLAQKESKADFQINKII
jgi:hypothetical protein